MAAQGEEMLTSGPKNDLQVGVDGDSSPVISKNRNFRYQVRYYFSKYVFLFFYRVRTSSHSSYI